MPKADFKSVDEYIAAQPPAVQDSLERLRSTIRDNLPAAEEVISYKIPTYKLNGEVVLYFAGWKHHYSLYPATGRMMAAFKTELVPYKINKATIRFPFSEPVPVQLIARIAKFRAKEVAERQKTKAIESKKSVRKDIS